MQQGDVRRLAEYPAAGLTAKLVGPVVDDDSAPYAAALPEHGLVTTEHLSIGDIPSRDHEDQLFAARGWQPLQGAADEIDLAQLSFEQGAILDASHDEIPLPIRTLEGVRRVDEPSSAVATAEADRTPGGAGLIHGAVPSQLQLAIIIGRIRERP